MKKITLLLFCIIVLAFCSCEKSKSLIESEEQSNLFALNKSTRTCPNCRNWSAITVTNSTMLKTTIENAESCTIINLPAGNYNVSSEIYISKKCHLKIRGAGMGRTVLLLT
ncbi:MAG TPA: hypothetical protein PKN41_10345, partial [Bacteroidales bacterium]|nr:hypothetical protein [Bacteroidales bacterium]